MQTLSRDQLLKILNLTGGAYDQLQHVGHAMLAFGSPLPGTPGRYLPLDAVAMAIGLGLTPSIGREYATAIVAGYFNQWAAAAGHAEADPGTNYFTAIGGVRWNQKKKRPELLLVTAGTMEQIAEDFGQVGGLVGAWYVNVTEIIQRIRRRARELGIDIEEPFYFAPDDPRFSEIIRAVKSERDGRIERLRKDKKKFGTAKKLHHRTDIAAVPRVKDVGYPIEMTGPA